MWAELERELDHWAEAGRAATFWWRDDDAVEDTAALRRLFDLRARFGVPIAIAAIPARADETLARARAASPETAVLQHGYAHRNHTPDDRAKSELGDDRPVTDVLADLAAGRARMDDLFGDDWLPVMVPPWNRIDAAVVAALPEAGYRGLSVAGARAAPDAVPDAVPDAKGALKRINIHVDLIDWRATRAYAGDAAVLGEVLDHLGGRRRGDADADEPTGMMTHHLAHDDGCWVFIEAFLAATAAHPAARWVDAAGAFGLGR